MWIEDINELIVVFGVLGVVAGIGPLPGQGQTTSGAGRWFPPFSHFDVYVLKWLTCDDMLLNPCCKKKWRRRVGLNSWWLSKWLWNVEQVLNECWNNGENVRVLNWPFWGEHLIELWWILNRMWCWGLLWIWATNEW